jgi:anti-sigma-K factor RskA
MTEREHHDIVNGNGSDDTEALLGAYVLDAVDEVDRRRVERLLATSPEARAEVERLNAAADRLAEAAAAGATAPSELFGTLMAKVAAGPAAAAGPVGEGAPTPPPAVEPVVLPRLSGDAPAVPVAGHSTVDIPRGVASFERHAEARRSRTPWILSAAAVVVLFVVGAVVVGNRSGDGDGVTDSVAAMEQMAAQAATMPGARTGELTDPENSMAVQVVVDPDGHAFVMSGVLPPLDSAHTYQLWSAEGGTMVSLGLLGSSPAMSVVGVDPSVHELAITVEPIGGSPGPTAAPMASGSLNTV